MIHLFKTTELKLYWIILFIDKLRSKFYMYFQRLQIYKKIIILSYKCIQIILNLLNIQY